MHHTGTHSCEFEHLFKADFTEFAGRRFDAWVRCINSIDVRMNNALAWPKCGGQRDGGRVTAASAECRDITVGVDSLETTSHNDVAVVQLFSDRFRRNRQNLRFRMMAVGRDTQLRARHADSLAAHFVYRHRHQSDADLFASRQQHVHVT